MTNESELASMRLQLGNAQDETAAVRYELECYKREFVEPSLNGDNGAYARSWLRALGDKAVPKAHLIDSLAITTRIYREFWEKHQH